MVASAEPKPIVRLLPMTLLTMMTAKYKLR